MKSRFVSGAFRKGGAKKGNQGLQVIQEMLWR